MKRPFWENIINKIESQIIIQMRKFFDDTPFCVYTRKYREGWRLREELVVGNEDEL